MCQPLDLGLYSKCKLSAKFLYITMLQFPDNLSIFLFLVKILYFCMFTFHHLKTKYESFLL